MIIITIKFFYSYLESKYKYFSIILLFSLSIYPSFTQAELTIPRQLEWKDRGVVLRAGPKGSWDVRLHGMISPCTVVKKNGTYFLYYIGADGDRSTDGGPRYRALGVATSPDGIDFTKYRRNPILTYFPHNNEEEGIYSAGATLDGSGNIVLYYGALDAGSSNSASVDSDVRLSVSANGLDFIDLGDVLSHADRTVWGYGDELFPVGVFNIGRTWYLYYIAEGNDTKWDLGLAWGESPRELINTQAVLKDHVDIIGGGDPIRLDSDTIGLFVVRDFAKSFVEVNAASMNAPWILDSNILTYDFNGYRHSTVFLDSDAKTWFMYIREADGDQIRVFTAPANGLENTSLSVSNPMVSDSYEVIQNGVHSGAFAYVDRDYIITDFPDYLGEATYIRTRNDHKDRRDYHFLSFEVNIDVTIYIAHDERILNKPLWLANFTHTGDKLATSDATFDIFAREFSAGPIILGGNEGGSKSMYIPIIVPKR